MSIIKSFSVGYGDMFYIKHNSDNFSIIDCCMGDDNKEKFTDEIIAEKSEKKITRFISTHPDKDHFQGLAYLDDQIEIINFYCVENKVVKKVQDEDFDRYCVLRDGDHHFYIKKDCSRKWMNISDDERGSSGINVLWPDTDAETFKEALQTAERDGSAVNNLSPIITYSAQNNVVAMWMGDMEHKFLEKIEDKIEWPKVDVLFAPHHGRASGTVPSNILKKIQPQIIVVGEAPSEDLYYYPDYKTITQNSAGNIVFDCSEDKIHIYVSKDYKGDTSFLIKENAENNKHGNYIGSLIPRGAINGN